MYWQAMTVIDAQDMIMKMRIQDWPHMKQEKRSEYHRQLFRLAYPATEEQTISFDQLAKMQKDGVL